MLIALLIYNLDTKMKIKYSWFLFLFIKNINITFKIPIIRYSQVEHISPVKHQEV